jgi:hypothetical protein
MDAERAFYQQGPTSSFARSYKAICIVAESKVHCFSAALFISFDRIDALGYQ